jgi:hypothetical protein
VQRASKTTRVRKAHVVKDDGDDIGPM